MDDARIRTNRFLLNWKWVQPTAGPFSWGAMDKFIGRLAVHGIRALPSVWGNPDWVQGGDARPPLDRPPDDHGMAELPQGAGGALRAGRQLLGTPRTASSTAQNATPLPIQSWQIWNEPNLKKFFVPYPSPQKYARLLKISHGAIRSRDPRPRSCSPECPATGT